MTRQLRLGLLSLALLGPAACDAAPKGAEGPKSAAEQSDPSSAPGATGTSTGAQVEASASHKVQSHCYDDGSHEICLDPRVRGRIWAGPIGQTQVLPSEGSLRLGRNGLPKVRLRIGRAPLPQAQLASAPTGGLRATCKGSVRQYRRNARHPDLQSRVASVSTNLMADPCALLGVHIKGATRSGTAGADATSTQP